MQGENALYDSPTSLVVQYDLLVKLFEDSFFQFVFLPVYLCTTMSQNLFKQLTVYLMGDFTLTQGNGCSMLKTKNGHGSV